MLDEIKRLVLFTWGVAELTRNRAEEIVREWVDSGDVRRDQAQTLVRDLIEWSHQNRRELISFISSEIQAQMASLGVATKRDVERLERRVARLEKEGAAGRREAAAKKKPSTRAKATPGGAPSTGPARPPAEDAFVDPTDNP